MGRARRVLSRREPGCTAGGGRRRADADDDAAIAEGTVTFAIAFTSSVTCAAVIDAPGRIKSSHRLRIEVDSVGFRLPFTAERGHEYCIEKASAAVRVLLGEGPVECPAIGRITNADCAAWREKAKTLSSGNPLRVQMRAACRNCERNKR